MEQIQGNENQNSSNEASESERQLVEPTARPWRCVKDSVGSTHFKIVSSTLTHAIQRWVVKDAENRTGKGFAAFTTEICDIAPSFNGSGKDSGPSRLIDLAEMRANAELICKAVNSYSPDREAITNQMYEALQSSYKTIESDGWGKFLALAEIKKALVAFDQLNQKL